jgi:Ca-activated chloride channel homolog
MAYCINPACTSPQNRDESTSCLSCGKDILLNNRYLPISLLGQGGFGRTFKAINNRHPNKKLCVIKQFIFQGTNPTTQETAINLFRQEAKHLQSLGDHPQVPALVDFFSENNQSCLVQEFIDGQNLEYELANNGKFSQAQVRELLDSLLPVLDYLHNQTTPVIHRDIKPANIIRRRHDGVMVLVDFGAAKLATHTMLAKTGTSIGSAEFAAPEQAMGKPAFASDIYSLGVTCIHLLTNTRPFDLYSPNTESGWAWQDYLGDSIVDRSLRKILDKMIVQSSANRYRSAKEVISGLVSVR